MESEALIFNDETKCLHVAIQGTHKFRMMACINYKDQALILK
jgi:hypothetical protein